MSRRLIIGAILISAFMASGVAGAILLIARHRIAAFREAQQDPAVSITIDEDRVPSATSVVISDASLVQELLAGLPQATFFLPNHPRTLKILYVDVRRKSGRVDEYEVFFDTRGVDFDHIEMIHRHGNGVTYYPPAFHTSTLRPTFLVAYQAVKSSKP